MSLVLGANTVDEISITVTGTSITDAGVRDAGPDTEVITIPHPSVAGAYFETAKKWLGQVTIQTTGGTPKTCNYFWSKYWDNRNSHFILTAIEVTMFGDNADTGVDFLIRHHNATGWTFNAGADPTPPTAVASMVGDHVTETNLANNTPVAWKRTNLSEIVLGGDGEGLIFESVQSQVSPLFNGNVIITTMPHT